MLKPIISYMSSSHGRNYVCSESFGHFPILAGLNRKTNSYVLPGTHRQVMCPPVPLWKLFPFLFWRLSKLSFSHKLVTPWFFVFCTCCFTRIHRYQTGWTSQKLVNTDSLFVDLLFPVLPPAPNRSNFVLSTGAMVVRTNIVGDISPRGEWMKE